MDAMTTDVAAGLPAGLTTRALTMADAAAVTAVISAQELDDVGEVLIEEADIVADWQRPGYDVTASSIGVFDDDRLVAYAESGSGGRGDAAVHPDYRGRGIGTRLAAWMRARAGEQGQPEVGMPVPQGSPGDVLLAGLGYRVRWTSWVLQLPEGASIPARPLPEGYVVREAGPDEYEAAWTVQEDAFLEWSVRERSTFEDWEARTIKRPGFEPDFLRVAVDPAGAVVGASVLSLSGGCAYVSQLAVDKGQRHRGLARALLVDSFRVGRDHGAPVSELSTDSRTGALGLYEKVGMVTTSVWVNRGIDL